MKYKNFKVFNTLLCIALFFLFIFQVSGCDSTADRNVPTTTSGNTLTLSVSPTTIAADGKAFTTITATVTGQVPGTVNFTSSLGTLSVSSASVEADGEAEVTLSSSTGGVATIRATAGSFSASTTATFSLGSISVSGTGDVTDSDAGASESTSISFTVTDVNGTAISGIDVTLATPISSNSGVTASWSDSSPNTNSSGVATSFLTTNSADIGTDVTITLTASASGAGSASAQVIFKCTTAGDTC